MVHTWDVYIWDALVFVYDFSGRTPKKLLTRVPLGNRTTDQGERKRMLWEIDWSLIVTSARVTNWRHLPPPPPLFASHVPALSPQAQQGRCFREPSSPLLHAAFNTTCLSTHDPDDLVKGREGNRGLEEATRHKGESVSTNSRPCAYTDSRESHLCSRRNTQWLYISQFTSLRYEVFLRLIIARDCDAQQTTQDWWKVGMISEGETRWPLSQWEQ